MADTAIARVVEGSTPSAVFESAIFYDCTDPETLQLTDPIEAIAGRLDGESPHPSGSIVALIAALGPITVAAYNPRVVGEKWIEQQAVRLANQFEENFDEEFGGGDGDTLAIPSTDNERALREMRGWIKQRLRRLDPWQCDRVAERVYSVAEVEALMRKHRAEWFEETGVAP